MGFPAPMLRDRVSDRGKAHGRTARLVLLTLLCSGLASCTDTLRSSPRYLDHIEYTEFAPPARPGPAVIVLSGSAGPEKVVFVAEDLVKLGYYVILTDGNFVHGDWYRDGGDNLRRLILMARSSTHARPGKVAVIGLSRGGTGVLVHATAMPDLVAVAVSFYPGTAPDWIPDKEAVISRMSVPTLAFAGEADFGPLGMGCCTVATIRTIAARAKERGKPFELYTYPGAGHDFNWRTGFPSADNRRATEDSWRRTVAALRRYLGPP